MRMAMLALAAMMASATLFPAVAWAFQTQSAPVPQSVLPR